MYQVHFRFLPTRRACTLETGQTQERSRPPEKCVRFRETCKPYVYLLPALALFGVFTAYPILRSVQLSFMDYEFLRPQEAKYIGLDNYREALSASPDKSKNDQKVVQTLGNTLYFAVLFLPPYVLLPIPIAFLIDRLKKGQAFMRVATLLPIVVSGAVIAVLWVTIYDSTYGLLLGAGQMLGSAWRGVLWAALPLPAAFLAYSLFRRAISWQRAAGIAGVMAAALAALWLLMMNPRIGPLALLGGQITELAKLNVLGTKETAMPSLVVMSVWHGFGFNVLMYLVTLASIPPELYEAASVDGATGYRTFWNVTLPLLRPAVYLVTVLATIGSLKVFGPMFIMTGGGPANSTISVVLYIYQTAFQFGYLRFGYAAALAFLLAFVVLAFALLASRLNRPVDK